MFPKSSRKTESHHKNMLFLVIKARNSGMWSYKLDLSTTEGKTKSNYLQYRSFYYSQLDIVVHYARTGQETFHLSSSSSSHGPRFALTSLLLGFHFKYPICLSCFRVCAWLHMYGCFICLRPWPLGFWDKYIIIFNRKLHLRDHICLTC